MFQRDLLKGRAVFLTGGGTGLGRSMALRFAELGARIFLVGRREEPLREACDEIHRRGGAAACTTCDVRDYGAVEAAAANQRVQRCGRHRLERNLSLYAGFWQALDLPKARRKRIEYRDHVCGCQLRFWVCGAFCLREGGRFGDDHVAGRGVGEVSHPAERHRAGALSDRGCVVAANAFEAIRRARQGQASYEAFRPARGARQSRRVSY